MVYEEIRSWDIYSCLSASRGASSEWSNGQKKEMVRRPTRLLAKRHDFWIFFYVKFFSMPLHDATWTEGYLIWIRRTYLMALWPLDARMVQDQREEKKRCFMKQLSTHLFVKIQIWWKIVSFLLRRVPNREESLLMWRDASGIPC